MINIARLARDDRGASIVELAFVVPVMASLLVGMVDLSRAYSHKLKLEQAAQRAIERVQQYQASSSTTGTLSSEAVEAAGTGSNVAIDVWLECNGVRATDYNTVCSTGQTYARWVQVDVSATYTPLFKSKHYPGANADGTFTLHGIAGMRTQ